MHFEHFKINHSCNFIDPICPQIHIQTIKSAWNLLRRLFKSKGTNTRAILNEYILEFQFRKENKNIFEALLEVIKKTNNFQ